MNCVRKNQLRGFTLIELLIVVSIMAIVISVIGACLAGGIKAWDTARTFNNLENNAFIALDIMGRDIRNSLTLYNIGFDGKQSEISFPAYINKDNGQSVGIIKYELDKKKHAILRIENSWRGKEIQRERLLSNVKSIKFSYYKESTSTWQNVGESITNFPDRVGIKILLENANRKVSMEKDVLLPLRGR